MDSRYFNVSDNWDNETGSEKYENLSKDALRDSVSDYDSRFKYYSPEDLLNVETLDEAKVLLDKIKLFRNSFSLEIEKLRPVFEHEDFDSDDLDEKWDAIEQLVSNNEDLFDEAESDFDIDFGDFSLSDINDVNTLANNLNEDSNSVLENLGSMIEKFVEKITDTEEFHEFTKDVLEELGLDNLGMELESVIEKLVDGEDFSDIYSDWEDNQYDFMEPAYNYVYPLNYEPTTKQCVEVAKETNAVVIEIDREYYIALCGAGMDMSQDIGYAKGVICGNTLSLDDCRSINTQKKLTISEDKYYALMEKIEESLETHISSAEYKLKEIKELLPKKEETHLDKIVKDFEDKNSPKKEDDVVDSNESKKVRRDR